MTVMIRVLISLNTILLLSAQSAPSSTCTGSGGEIYENGHVIVNANCYTCTCIYGSTVCTQKECAPCRDWSTGQPCVGYGSDVQSCKGYSSCSAEFLPKDIASVPGICCRHLPPPQCPYGSMNVSCGGFPGINPLGCPDGSTCSYDHIPPNIADASGECCRDRTDGNCLHEGHFYKPGETFSSDCNTCLCGVNGMAACTTRNCSSLVVKPGFCPSSGGGACYDMCVQDSDCPDMQRCCHNGCARICVHPVPPALEMMKLYMTDRRGFTERSEDLCMEPYFRSMDKNLDGFMTLEEFERAFISWNLVDDYHVIRLFNYLGPINDVLPISAAIDFFTELLTDDDKLGKSTVLRSIVLEILASRDGVLLAQRREAERGGGGVRIQ